MSIYIEKISFREECHVLQPDRARSLDFHERELVYLTVLRQCIAASALTVALLLCPVLYLLQVQITLLQLLT